MSSSICFRYLSRRSSCRTFLIPWLRSQCHFPLSRLNVSNTSSNFIVLFLDKGFENKSGSPSDDYVTTFLLLPRMSDSLVDTRCCLLHPIRLRVGLPRLSPICSFTARHNSSGGHFLQVLQLRQTPHLLFLC